MKQLILMQKATLNIRKELTKKNFKAFLYL